MHPNPSLFAAADAVSRLGLSLLPVCLYAGAAIWGGAHLSGWLAPAVWRAVAWSAPVPHEAAARVAAQHWFGEARPPEAPLLQLSGVFAPMPGLRGFAVVASGGVLHALMTGDAFDGWTVGRIDADGLELEHGTLRHFYALPAHAAAGSGERLDDAQPLPDPAEGVW